MLNESYLIRRTLNGKGTVPDRLAFAIDLSTGCPISPPRLPYHAGLVRFDPEWQREVHGLFMQLINVRTRDPELEWLDLTDFFREAHYIPSGRASWPRERIEPVVMRWRVYRNFARAMALARVPADWVLIRDEYPEESKRAMRTPPQKEETLPMEVYDPLDMMWIAHTYGMVDRRNGPRYARCANHPGCERFVPAPWPRGQGRPPRFCEPSCDAKGRDLAGHKRRKKDYDDKCREMLRTAWQSLPAKERKFDRDQQRRLMATKLFKFVRKQLAKIPGVRGERWIAKQLKREEFSGENQRAGKE